MSTTSCNTGSTDNERTTLGPASKFNAFEAEEGLTDLTEIQHRPKADEHGETPLETNNTELTYERPNEVDLKQPRPVRRALFKDALSRVEKVVRSTGSEGELQRESGDVASPSKEDESTEACAGQDILVPKPPVTKAEIFRRRLQLYRSQRPIKKPAQREPPDLSNNVFWQAHQRRLAEQPPLRDSSGEESVPSTMASAPGDTPRGLPSFQPTPRTLPPPPERTPTPPHTPYPIRRARLIMERFERYGPEWNPIETEYNGHPDDSDSETEWGNDDDLVRDPYGTRTMRDFATETTYLGRTQSCPPCFSCDCEEARAAKRKLAGKAELKEHERAPIWWWWIWRDADRIIRRDF